MSPRSDTPLRRSDTVLPPADLHALTDLSHFLDGLTQPAALIGPDGEQVPLPMEVYDVLVDVVDAMKQQRAVTIAPVDQQLTTQEAADLLGISRPTLIKLIDSGDISCERPTGSRHRRLRLADVLNYRDHRAQVQDESLQRLVENAEEDGLYDIPPDTIRDAVDAARSQRRQAP